jgi:hypothetical protein
VHFERWITSNGGWHRLRRWRSRSPARADLAIIDPVKCRKEADSETQRETVWYWFTSDLRTRLKPGAATAAVLEWVRGLRELALELAHGNRSSADKVRGTVWQGSGAAPPADEGRAASCNTTRMMCARFVSGSETHRETAEQRTAEIERLKREPGQKLTAAEKRMPQRLRKRVLSTLIRERRRGMPAPMTRATFSRYFIAARSSSPTRATLPTQPSFLRS